MDFVVIIKTVFSKMIRDTQRTRKILVMMVFILTFSHRTTGGGSWNRLERMFIQEHHQPDHWDENRIIFPDMLEDHPKPSWWPTTTPQHDDRRSCEANCKISREYSPVCGTNGVTYQNMGQLLCAVRCGVAVDFHRPSACSSGVPTITNPVPIVTTTTTATPLVTTTHRNEKLEECIRRCPSTPEYNPICGTNHVTYFNAGKMQCANICGENVALWRHSPCPTLSTTTSTVAPTTNSDRDKVIQECIINCPATSEYNPVCGTDKVNYCNLGKLTCANLCGIDVSVQNRGRCKPASNAQQLNNFDPTTSKEGYGEESIEPRYLPGVQRGYIIGKEKNYCAL